MFLANLNPLKYELPISNCYNVWGFICLVRDDMGLQWFDVLNISADVGKPGARGTHIK